MAAIALVDDVRICRMPIRQAFERVGHRVWEPEPTSIFDVMASLRAGSPDLVITDLEMPGCAGVSLIRSIREDPVLGDTPILVVSSHSDDEMILGLSRQNIQGFLVKPVRARQVLITATAILEGLALEGEGEPLALRQALG